MNDATILEALGLDPDLDTLEGVRERLTLATEIEQATDETLHDLLGLVREHDGEIRLILDDATKACKAAGADSPHNGGLDQIAAHAERCVAVANDCTGDAVDDLSDVADVLDVVETYGGLEGLERIDATRDFLDAFEAYFGHVDVHAELCRRFYAAGLCGYDDLDGVMRALESLPVVRRAS